MSARSKFTTVLIVGMLILSMVAIAAPGTIAKEDTDNTVQTLENDEELFLVFGADLNGQSLEEYVESYEDHEPNANPSESNSSSVVQYQDVDQLNLNQEGEAVSIAIDGGQATAIQEVNQENTNIQDGEAVAENVPGESHNAEFSDVDTVHIIFGEGDHHSFDGWAIVDDDGSVSQAAEATVSQSQAVGQANVNERTTALAFAEEDSASTALQQTKQSNQNLQQGSATATNIFASDLEDKDDYDRKDVHEKKGPTDDRSLGQDAEASVEQAQEISQTNVNEFGNSVAIAVGENSSATAVQLTDQSNLNEQLGFAEAVNVMMDSGGMNVATAGEGAGEEIISHDGHEYPKSEKKAGDGDHDEYKDVDEDDATQTAEASVTQVQGVEQANINVNSSAEAIATNGSASTAVQLTFQQNLNAQVASADAINVLEELDESAAKEFKDDDYDHDHEATVFTNSTTVSIGDEPVDGVDHTAVDYDSPNDQFNDPTQYATAAVEQRQEVVQTNLNSNTALAVSEDGGNANAFQMSMQENENVLVTADEETTIGQAALGDEERTDHDGEPEKDDESEADTDVVTETETEADAREKEDDSMPGFGIAVALIAMLVAAMLTVRRQG